MLTELIPSSVCLQEVQVGGAVILSRTMSTGLWEESLLELLLALQKVESGVAIPRWERCED